MEVDPPPDTITGLTRWMEGDQVLTMTLQHDPAPALGVVRGDPADTANVCLPSWFSPHARPYLGSNTHARSLTVTDRLLYLLLHRYQRKRAWNLTAPLAPHSTCVHAHTNVHVLTDIFLIS